MAGENYVEPKVQNPEYADVQNEMLMGVLKILQNAPLDDLMNRFKVLEGCDNEYGINVRRIGIRIRYKNVKVELYDSCLDISVKQKFLGIPVKIYTFTTYRSHGLWQTNIIQSILDEIHQIDMVFESRKSRKIRKYYERMLSLIPSSFD